MINKTSIIYTQSLSQLSAQYQHIIYTYNLYKTTKIKSNILFKLTKTAKVYYLLKGNLWKDKFL